MLAKNRSCKQSNQALNQRYKNARSWVYLSLLESLIVINREEPYII